MDKLPLNENEEQEDKVLSEDEKFDIAKEELRQNYVQYLEPHDVIWPGGQELTGLTQLTPNLRKVDHLSSFVD